MGFLKTAPSSNYTLKTIWFWPFRPQSRKEPKKCQTLFCNFFANKSKNQHLEVDQRQKLIASWDFGSFCCTWRHISQNLQFQLFWLFFKFSKNKPKNWHHEVNQQQKLIESWDSCFFCCSGNPFSRWSGIFGSKVATLISLIYPRLILGYDTSIDSFFHFVNFVN